MRRWYAGKLAEWDWGRVVCARETIVAFLAAIGAHIDQLFVDPDHQRVGLGSALLQGNAGAAPAAGDVARVRAEHACPCLL